MWGGGLFGGYIIAILKAIFAYLIRQAPTKDNGRLVVLLSTYMFEESDRIIKKIMHTATTAFNVDNRKGGCFHT